MSWVPVIDISAGSDDAAAAIGEAARRVGFFSIVGHGVSPEIIEATWNTARAFFDQPIGQKMCVAMPTSGYPYGYSPVQGEMLAASLGNYGLADLKESFAIGPVDQPTHQMPDPDEASVWSPSLWPDGIPGFQTAWQAQFRAMADLSARLLSIMAVALDLDPHHFESLIDRHTSAMRAVNYPGAASGSVQHGQLGAGAHTDYGTLTVLVADPVQAGLEVQDTNGDWQAVAPVSGALVVNLGDALARWTNDRWRSTMHRVVVPNARRQSIAFFHNANWDARIECLPTCLGPGEQARYATIEAGPHLMSKFRSTVVSG